MLDLVDLTDTAAEIDELRARLAAAEAEIARLRAALEAERTGHAGGLDWMRAEVARAAAAARDLPAGELRALLELLNLAQVRLYARTVYERTGGAGDNDAPLPDPENAARPDARCPDCGVAASRTGRFALGRCPTCYTRHASRERQAALRAEEEAQAGRRDALQADAEAALPPPPPRAAAPAPACRDCGAPRAEASGWVGARCSRCYQRERAGVPPVGAAGARARRTEPCAECGRERTPGARFAGARCRTCERRAQRERERAARGLPPTEPGRGAAKTIKTPATGRGGAGR